MKHRYQTRLILLLYLALLTPLAVRAQGPAESGRRPALRAAGRGNPWINLQDGRPLPTTYTGDKALTQALIAGEMNPLSLTAGDFDEDGVPDLVSGYADCRLPIADCRLEGHPKSEIRNPKSEIARGILTLHRGNVDAIYPNSPQARQRKAAGTFSDAPFLSPAHVFGLPTAPDFLGTGDFDNDGHLDVVAAARGEDRLYLLPGDGKGGFGPAQVTKLPGKVTALAVGEVNRRDGLMDLAVGVSRPAGPQVLVFEGPDGALQREPESFAVPAPISDLAIGQLDDHYAMDLAVAAGNRLLIIHGRDRKLSLSAGQQAQVLPATVDQHPLPYTIAALALGDFVPEEEYRLELALLAEDGAVHLVEIGDQGLEISPSLSPGFPSLAGGTDLVRARVSSLPTDDLVVIDRTNRQLHILVGSSTPAAGARGQNSQPETLKPVALDVAGEPVAVLPMRLNPDALSDLVVLKSGPNPLTVVPTAPMATFTVNYATIDLPDGDTTDGKCDTGNANDGYTGECTLRAAIQQANASAGATTIQFNLGSGTPRIGIQGSLPTINVPVTILGNTGSATRVEIQGVTAYAQGLRITSGNSTIRSLVINCFRGGNFILEQNGNNIVEDNFIGTNADGTAARCSGGVSIMNSSNNTIGGTTQQARNVLGGVSIGGVATGNQIQGNYLSTDVHGTSALRLGGVEIWYSGATNNTVGGTTKQARNIISGGASWGIRINGSVRGGGSSPPTGNLVQGNYIGTDKDGAADLGNAHYGVYVVGASDNTIGGTAAGAGNVISGNDREAGVRVGIYATGILVQGNHIGVDKNGTGALGNVGYGVEVNNASDNTIGGAAAGAGNIIAYNSSYGVRVFNWDDPTTGNRVLSNSIFSNQDLGINLGRDTFPTANDDGDSDEGANRLQNWPEIAGATIQGSQLQVNFQVRTAPANATYPLQIQFFLADSTDTHAEGKTYLGEVQYLEAEAQTFVAKSFTPSQMPGANAPIVATATDAAGNTSEFSYPPVLVTGVTPGLVFKVDNDGNVFADGTYQSPAADFAEMWPASPVQRSRGAEEQGSNPPCTRVPFHLCSELEPGDVLALGPDGGVMLAGLPDAGPVVGVYATQPGFLGDSSYAVRNTQHATRPHIPVALVGIVPVKVSVENGPIRPGDLLGLSSTPGVAARARPVSFGGWRFYLAGSFFGKALEPAQDRGAIRVLLMLH